MAGKPLSKSVSLIGRVRAFGRRHDLWRSDTRVICALSGGSDSVALLFLLHDLHRAGDLVLDCAAHLHHEIRGVEADADQQFCRELCERLNVPFITNHVDVPAAAARARVSIEVAARRARHAFFANVRGVRGAHVVATAHTENDQAETILLRVVRGAGGRGLSGIAPRRDYLIRPLLTMTRDALQAELTARGQTWREDLTNADLAIPRNRVRHELLPYLEQHFNPAVQHALARLADVSRADESWADALVDAALTDVISTQNGNVSLNVSRVTASPEALARRFVRRALALANPGRGCTVEEVDLVLAVVHGDRTAAEISGLRVERFRNSEVLITRAVPQRPRRRGITPAKP
jgi:tRNA(Ile)-lysidine synthase